MNDRVAKIVAAQTAAAKLQAACKWCPGENFFPNMIGHMGTVFGPELAQQVVTIFEITRQEHEEMMDDMCAHPELLKDAIDEAFRRIGK